MTHRFSVPLWQPNCKENTKTILYLGSTVNSFLSKIIEINEETQDYRHWINDKWKGFVTADEAPPFAPYFTNYDKHYNPYFYTQYDEKCLQMMKLAQQAQQHAAVSNVVGPSPSCPQGIIPFPNLSLLQSGGVLTTHPSTTVVSAPATFTALSTSANGFVYSLSIIGENY